jgi:mRNA interferase YafQ
VKNIFETTQFRKDIKRVQKKGKNLEKLKSIVRHLAIGESLEPRYRDHQLTGLLRGSRDCHIEPDWHLIYHTDSDSLFLERTGSHSELFKK